MSWAGPLVKGQVNLDGDGHQIWTLTGRRNWTLAAIRVSDPHGLASGIQVVDGQMGLALRARWAIRRDPRVLPTSAGVTQARK